MPTFTGQHPNDTLSCMQLEEDDLREFMEIWSGEFHESLTLEDARRHATALMELYALLVSSGSEADS